MSRTRQSAVSIVRCCRLCCRVQCLQTALSLIYNQKQRPWKLEAQTYFKLDQNFSSMSFYVLLNNHQKALNSNNFWDVEYNVSFYVDMIYLGSIKLRLIEKYRWGGVEWARDDQTVLSCFHSLIFCIVRALQKWMLPTNIWTPLSHDKWTLLRNNNYKLARRRCLLRSPAQGS